MSALSIAVKPRAREQGGFYRGYKPTPLDYQRANALGTPLPYGMWPDGKDVQSLSLTYRSKMDIVSISSIGRRLHVREDVKTEDIDSKWARVTGKGSDRVLRFVDKHISRAGKLLERMKTIAETARDDTLYESDRFALQMEMGRLQHDLNKESALVSGARSLIEEMPEKELVEYIENLYGSFDSSEAYKMLIRAEERLMNGEEWDIAETFTPVVKTFEENGDLFGYIDGFKWERTEDADVASVSEILKAKGRSVMDYKSAIVSAEEIDKDIERLIEGRARLAAFAAEDEASQEAPGEKQKKLFVFVSGFQDVSKKLYRDMVEIVYGDMKDEDGRYVELINPKPENSAKSGTFKLLRKEQEDNTQQHSGKAESETLEASGSLVKFSGRVLECVKHVEYVA